MKKKDYMKPAIRTVELRHRTFMQNASPVGPNQMDGKPFSVYRDRQMRIEDKGDIW